MKNMPKTETVESIPQATTTWQGRDEQRAGKCLEEILEERLTAIPIGSSGR
jgi:hypothetical protein